MNNQITEIYKPYTPPFKYREGISDIVDTGGNKVLDIRGWGFLTGRASLALDDETAISIQDGIGRHVVNLMNEDAKLNGYNI